MKLKSKILNFENEIGTSCCGSETPWLSWKPSDWDKKARKSDSSKRLPDFLCGSLLTGIKKPGKAILRNDYRIFSINFSNFAFVTSFALILFASTNLSSCDLGYTYNNVRSFEKC